MEVCESMNNNPLHQDDEDAISLPASPMVNGSDTSLSRNTSTTFLCRQCKQVLPASYFFASRRSLCKQCVVVKNKRSLTSRMADPRKRLLMAFTTRMESQRKKRLASSTDGVVDTSLSSSSSTTTISSSSSSSTAPHRPCRILISPDQVDMLLEHFSNQSVMTICSSTASSIPSNLPLAPSLPTSSSSSTTSDHTDTTVAHAVAAAHRATRYDRLLLTAWTWPLPSVVSIWDLVPVTRQESRILFSRIVSDETKRQLLGATAVARIDAHIALLRDGVSAVRPSVTRI